MFCWIYERALENLYMPFPLASSILTVQFECKTEGLFILGNGTRDQEMKSCESAGCRHSNDSPWNVGAVRADDSHLNELSNWDDSSKEKTLIEKVDCHMNQRKLQDTRKEKTEKLQRHQSERTKRASLMICGRDHFQNSGGIFNDE